MPQQGSEEHSPTEAGAEEVLEAEGEELLWLPVGSQTLSTQHRVSKFSLRPSQHQSNLPNQLRRNEKKTTKSKPLLRTPTCTRPL